MDPTDAEDKIAVTRSILDWTKSNEKFLSFTIVKFYFELTLKLLDIMPDPEEIYPKLSEDSISNDSVESVLISNSLINPYKYEKFINKDELATIKIQLKKISGRDSLNFIMYLGPLVQHIVYHLSGEEKKAAI